MKKFFVRISFQLSLLFLSIIIPLGVFLPRLNNRDVIWFLILMVSLGILLIMAIIYWNYKMILFPLRKLNEASKEIIDGKYETRVELKTGDSEIMRLAGMVNKIADEFENLEIKRKSFVANASHELRSPLTSMQGFLQAMLDGTITDEDRDKYIKIVLSETRRLSALINSMLDLSRMESGKYPLTMSMFELNSLISGVVDRFEPVLKKKEVQLDIDFVRSETYVYADKEKIFQVMINLIDNAIKYSPQNSRVLLTTHIHGKKVYITIKDSGFGMSKKEQLLIWDRFYMADKARTPTKSKGTGLGLSIVKRIIEDHKEVIWVESNKGQGATFIFTLTLFDNSVHSSNSKTLSQKA